MEQRKPKRNYSKNTNENRIRLKVAENPRYSSKQQEKIARKRDRRFKLVLTMITLLVLVGSTYFTLTKRNALIAKRYEYNNLVGNVISQELKRDRLKAKLENSVDVNRIQRYALEELGMVYVSGSSNVNEKGSDDGSDF